MTTTPAAPVTPSQDPFIAYITRVVEDPGARAQLRRAVRQRPEQAVTAHQYLASWTRDDRPHTAAVLYAVASWMAAHRDSTPDATRPTFGLALRRAAGRYSEATIETRLLALARATADQTLYQQVPALLRMLDSAGAIPSYTALKRDLLRWPSARDKVVRRWMEEYYRSAPPRQTPTADQPTDQPA